MGHGVGWLLCGGRTAHERKYRKQKRSSVGGVWAASGVG
ncbi:hypothetical protein DA2_2176 [Desulfovibrio sp. A2]|nr:hypothetical protein DA2_2176 [Desulfovibrio sp. A2]